VEVGDRVLAYDEGARTTGYYTVINKLAHEDRQLVNLVIDDEEIETTPEHPFYTMEGGWVPAGSLWIGAHILQADGTNGIIQEISFISSNTVMYNLSVDQAHTFFVGGGQWLVHNKCNWLNHGMINDEHSNNLVRWAQAYQDSLPEHLRKVTIGVVEIGEIRYVSLNGGANQEAKTLLQKIIINQPNTRFITGLGSGPEGHAERVLYQLFSHLDNLSIGISRASGPCQACITFFEEVNFSGLFWPIFRR
jgi:hypothetical protein